MKKYISAAKRKFKVGDYVSIINNDYFAGDWGVIKYINEDDGEYHVAMFNGDDQPIFYQDELKLMKHKPI